MNDKYLLIIILGIIFGSAVALLNPIESSPPPTPAYSNLTIIPPIAWPNDSQTSIQATNYRDIEHWTSDGSIEFNFTTYP